jgi:recombination protein RecT
MAEYLQKSKSAMALALPKHLNPDRMCRLALTCFATNPALKECTAQSILGSIVVACQLGLEPGVRGQGYLIPYKRTCTFVPGWQGLVGLLNNTGRATAWTGCVFEGDKFDFELGSAPKCVHLPGENYGDPNKIKWVYAVGKVNGSEQPVIEAWPMSRVLKHRDRYNKVGAKHYSFQNIEMYARKVVLLQVLKYMPSSIELNNAIVASDAAEMGNTSRVEDGTIIDVPMEGGGEDKFESAKTTGAPEKEKPGTGSDQPPGLETKPDPTDEEIEAQAKAEQERLTEEKKKVVQLPKQDTSLQTPPSETKPAATSAPVNPPVKPRTPPKWTSETDKPILRQKLRDAKLTEAQMCQFLKEGFMVVKDETGAPCLTIEDVEGSAPTRLATILEKFDTVAPRIAAMTGKSAQ